MAVNKVEYDGNTLMDITDTTATANDVASGKVFYGANGVRTTGTSSGSGGSPTDVQINGTSITSNGVADIITESAYDDTNNKIATMDDVTGQGYQTVNDVLNTIDFVSQSQEFQAYIAQLVSSLIPSGTEIIVNTFDDLPTQNVTELTKAYVKYPTLYDVTTLADLNYDITQMHDISPVAEPDFTGLTSSNYASITYTDSFNREFTVLVVGGANGLVMFGYVTNNGSANNTTPAFVYSAQADVSTGIPAGWSMYDADAQVAVSITFNEVPTIPAYTFTVNQTGGNPLILNDFFVDCKKHWAGEYRYVGGIWRYQQTVKTPYIESNNNTVPSSTALYETLQASSSGINTQITQMYQVLTNLYNQVQELDREIHGGGS